VRRPCPNLAAAAPRFLPSRCHTLLSPLLSLASGPQSALSLLPLLPVHASRPMFAPSRPAARCPARQDVAKPDALRPQPCVARDPAALKPRRAAPRKLSSRRATPSPTPGPHRRQPPRPSTDRAHCAAQPTAPGVAPGTDARPRRPFFSPR
jgi:hypothetical protein